MKTLILNGSPRKNGDTASLIAEFLKYLDGEYKIVNAYDSNVEPCTDCRWCWKNPGCIQKDEMQEIYQYIQECDNILIASPLHFSELTGKLLTLGSRLQTYYCAGYFRKEIPVKKGKKGAVIIVSGGNRDIEKPYATARMLLQHMNARNILPAVYGHDTNRQPASSDPSILQAVKDIAVFFNSTEV